MWRRGWHPRNPKWYIANLGLPMLAGLLGTMTVSNAVRWRDERRLAQDVRSVGDLVRIAWQSIRSEYAGRR